MIKPPSGKIYSKEKQIRFKKFVIGERIQNKANSPRRLSFKDLKNSKWAIANEVD